MAGCALPREEHLFAPRGIAIFEALRFAFVESPYRRRQEPRRDATGKTNGKDQFSYHPQQQGEKRFAFRATGGIAKEASRYFAPGTCGSLSPLLEMLLSILAGKAVESQLGHRAAAVYAGDGSRCLSTDYPSSRRHRSQPTLIRFHFR